MIRRADSLSTPTINDRRTVTLTGQLRAALPVGQRVVIEVECEAGAEVEIHERQA